MVNLSKLKTELSAIVANLILQKSDVYGDNKLIVSFKVTSGQAQDIQFQINKIMENHISIDKYDCSPKYEADWIVLTYTSGTEYEKQINLLEEPSKVVMLATFDVPSPPLSSDLKKAEIILPKSEMVEKGSEFLWTSIIPYAVSVGIAVTPFLYSQWKLRF